jgi:hypothetical protein
MGQRSINPRVALTGPQTTQLLPVTIINNISGCGRSAPFVLGTSWRALHKPISRCRSIKGTRPDLTRRLGSRPYHAGSGRRRFHPRVCESHYRAYLNRRLPQRTVGFLTVSAFECPEEARRSRSGRLRDVDCRVGPTLNCGQRVTNKKSPRGASRAGTGQSEPTDG